MDVGRGAINWRDLAGSARGRGTAEWPVGRGATGRGTSEWAVGPGAVSWRSLADLALGRGSAECGPRGAPGLGAQRRGGAPGPPLQGSWQPRGHYHQQLGQGFQHPGGPGQGLQQPLGPGSRAPVIQQPGAFYNGEAGLLPRLARGPYNVAGSGPGGQYSPGMGLCVQQPRDSGGSCGPALGGREPIPQQGGPYGSPQNKNLGCKSGVPEQGWAGPPVSVVQVRNRSPTGTGRSRDRSSAGTGRSRDRPSAGTGGSRDRPSAGTGRSRDRSPVGTGRSPDRSPAGKRRREGVSKSSPPILRSSSDRSSASKLKSITKGKQASKGRLLETKRTKLSLQRLRSLKVEPFPTRCSVTTIQAALQDMFGKFGEITSIQVNGKGDQRSAMVFYKFVKDRDSALLGTQGTSLFNTKVYVTVWPYQKTQSSTAEIESGFFAEEGSATLYVSNLEKNILRADVLRTFSLFGDIIYTEIQTLPGPYNYGVVQFTDQSKVQKAISEMNGLFLSRTKLKEKFGDSVSSNCIYLHDLFKTNFTVQYLIRHFSQFGTLEKVLLNRLTGRALVFFKDVSSAEKAIHKMREGSDGHLLTSDYAHREFVARFWRSFKMHGKDTKGYVSVLEVSEHGINILAKENETQSLAEEWEQGILVRAGGEEAADMLAEASEAEEADMLAEASEEEEADMLAEVGEEKTEVLDEAGEQQEEMAPLLDLSEKIEVSSDSGEEAAEPLPEVDEKMTPAFAEAVKKNKINPHSERKPVYMIPVLGRKRIHIVHL